MLPPQVQGENPQAAMLQQQIQQMSQNLAQLGQELQAAKTDKSLEEEKLRIDAYGKETDRLKVMSESMTPDQIKQIVMATVADVMNPGQIPQAGDVVQSAPAWTDEQKAAFDADLKIRLKQMDIDAAKESKLLGIRASRAKESQDPLVEFDENYVPDTSAAINGINAIMEGVGQLANGIGELKQIMIAPREVVRDENGRAVGARVRLENE
jgi:hypothetical protein